MEWSMAVNDMLQEEITKIDYTMLPSGFHGDVRALRNVQESLENLIDVMGAQSSQAQGLNRIITTAEKLRNSPSHSLYLLKDPLAKDGQGDVIGMLKVGHKHLFLFDGQDQVREVEPLCVLDFYVVHDRQRAGHGRVLFDHMLRDMAVNPVELAIDGPSSKMEQFLAKNYGIDKMIRQNNNFAVAPHFFDKFENARRKFGRDMPAVAAAAVGRFAAHKPHSSIGNVIHGGTSYYAESNTSDSSEREESPAPPSDDERPPESRPRAPGTNGPHYCAADYLADLEEQMALEEEVNASEWDEDHHAPPEQEEEEAAAAAAAPPDAPAPFADVPAAGLPSGSSAPAPGSGPGAAARRDSQLTDKGHFDVKFYHNRLW